MTVLRLPDPTSDFEKRLVSAMPKLRKLAFSLTTSTSDSDDLVQVTLQRAIEKQNQYRDDGNVENWLTSILRSVWKNEIRSRQVRRGNGTVNSLDLVETRANLQPDLHYEHAQIRERVNWLPEEFRSVLILVDYFGLSYRETASLLEIKQGTVMSRLARARQKIMDAANK